MKSPKIIAQRMQEGRRFEVAKKIFGILSIVFCLTGLTSNILAQTHTGTIKGKITNTEGVPLPDVTVYLSSPSLLGMRTYLTSGTGNIVFSGLPPGLYRLIVELPEYKTVKIDNVIIRVGKTVRMDIPLEATTAEEKITWEIPTFTLDAVSTKITANIDKDLLEHIPFPRDLQDIIDSSPGVFTERVPFQKKSFIHSLASKGTIFSFHGLTMNNPSDGKLLININSDAIEEIELETAALPAEVGLTDGGYINVITKSGGNRLGGDLILYHTSDNVSSLLRSEDVLGGPGISPPALDKRLWDTSLSLGGMIFENKFWFFGNARIISQKRTTPFIPWIDPQGIEHPGFNRSNEEKMGLFKMTGRLIPEFQVSGMFNYSNRSRSAYESTVGWNKPEESTRILDKEKSYTATVMLSYDLDPKTVAYGKLGFINIKSPLRLDEVGRNKPQYFDEGTGHFWGSSGFNENKNQTRFQITASIIHFQDNFLGGSHEFKAGGEFEYTIRDQTVWKFDNLSMNYYYDSPAYFGQDTSPSSGFLVDKGKISFAIAALNELPDNPKFESRRFALFVQDSVTLFRRLTLTLGLRFDRSSVDLSSNAKGRSGNNVSLNIGENLILPLYEVNPFYAYSIPRWKDIIIWNAFSPRFGLSFDIFGNGKSLFKTSYARYTEPILLDYLLDLNPLNPSRSHQFIWFDEDMNGEVDDNDTYVLYPEDYRIYNPDYYDKKIESGIQSPYTDEFTAGIHQEIFNNFSVRVSYIHKIKKNILANVLYDPDLNKDWYTLDQDTENWWIPFETIVPGVDDYPDTPVSTYFWSNNAPPLFSRLKNVPELKRKVQAIEIAFNKRMSNNWQLNGSVVFSEATGNANFMSGGNSGFSNTLLNPNSFVNLPDNSRFAYDIPFSLKLMGTYKFPLGFFLSFYYRYMSGIPWTRSVTVIPPSAWTQSNNAYSTPVTVLLERPGDRRTEPYSCLDLRIEKEFKTGRAGRFILSADIMNVLGNTNDFTFQNDGGFWYPNDENTSLGTRVLSSTYKNITSLFGTRTLRLTLRLSF